MARMQAIKGPECHGRWLAHRRGRRQGGQDADAGLGMGLALTALIFPWQVGAELPTTMAEALDLYRISAALRRVGWVRFWSQLTLGVVVVGVLFFSKIGSQLAANSQRALGLGPGLSFTTLSFLVLLWSLWHGWLVVRCGRALDRPVRPSKGETAQLLKRGLLGDLLGLTFATVGYQALAGSLFVQASLQAPGFFGAPINGGGLNRVVGFPITSIEMLGVLSNTQVLFAHLLGLMFSLWMLQRIHRRS